MDRKEAIDYIHGTRKFGKKLGLSNIRRLMHLLDDPHKQLDFVHIAGTNGKGSTAAYISSILMEEGYRVGIFTSPYLEKFEERIRINGKNIPGEKLGSLTCEVKKSINKILRNGEEHPTEFEIITAIALKYFYEEQCNMVVLEVGLGGRLDSTNVIEKSLLSVITSISMDHTRILGDTLDRIAWEKAGIIKQEGRVLLYPQGHLAENTIKKVCRQRQARLYMADFSEIKNIKPGIDGQRFDYKSYKDIKIGLAGDHQVFNAVMALEAAEILGNTGVAIKRDNIKKGLVNARWPGRMELVSKDPYFIIDGAHNPDAVNRFIDNLLNYFPHNSFTFIMGVMKDKAYMEMIKRPASVCKNFIALSPSPDRGLPVFRLAELAKPYCNNVLISDTIKGAINKALEISEHNGIIAAFGSLHYIGEIRKHFKENSGQAVSGQ